MRRIGGKTPDCQETKEPVMKSWFACCLCLATATVWVRPAEVTARQGPSGQRRRSASEGRRGPRAKTPSPRWRRRYRTIVSKLGHRDPFIRKEAAKALARLGKKAKAAIPRLIKALQDRDARVIRHASVALYVMGSAAIQPLTKASTRGVCSLRIRVVKILVRLAARHSLAIGGVVAVAKTCGSAFRLQLIRHISTKAQADPNPYERVAQELRTDILRAVSSSDVKLSVAALRLVAWQNVTDKRTVSIVHAAVRAPRQEIGTQAAEALARLCGRALKNRHKPSMSLCAKVVLPSLVRLSGSTDSRMRIRALMALQAADTWGRKTVRTILLRTIRDKNWEVRVQAVYGLNLFSKEKAVKAALRRALKDPSALVRGKADAILKGEGDLW